MLRLTVIGIGELFLFHPPHERVGGVHIHIDVVVVVVVVVVVGVGGVVVVGIDDVGVGGSRWLLQRQQTCGWLDG